VFQEQKNTIHSINDDNMWTDLVGESSFLVEVFDRAPSLANVRIEEVALKANGWQLELRFDLSEFPKNPPSKWERFNTVQIILGIYNVRTISIEKFSPDQRSTIGIEKTSDLLTLVVSGGVNIRCTAEAAMLNKLEAYRNEAA
jgi:Immunity protein 50